MTRYTLAALSLALLIPLAGCASSKPVKLAVCDGKHRRDANPYGTVLPGTPVAAPPTAGTADRPATLPPPPAPPADRTSDAGRPRKIGRAHV